MRAHPNSSQSQNFLPILSASIHQMAQPLSTIQGLLELALLRPTTAEQYRALTEDVLGHLRRAVEWMQFTASLARFQQPAADVHEVRLSAALESVVADLQLTLDTSQVQLVFSRPEHEPSIRISGTRLEKMLFYVLQAVQGCSQPGDSVQIDIRASVGHVILRIQPLSMKNGIDFAQPSQDSVVGRALAMADTIVSSAGGTFRVSIDPLLIVANFPVKRENRARAVARNKASAVAPSPFVVGSH